jgi:methylenetetrahydrofolate dehydrogenase (NADP+)/methenyltetrahydrofolate cyclohydrolase
VTESALKIPPAVILDGKAVAQQRTDWVKGQIQAIQAQGRPIPKLVVILVGDNPASQVYVKRKVKTAAEVGMLSDLMTLPLDTDEAVLLTHIDQLNADPNVHGILVQLPLPPQINADAVIERIDPRKDVDCFHPQNLGKLLAGVPTAAIPCTPKGVMTLLAAYNIPLAGKNAVVVGRSNIVGKPMAVLLLNANATVSLCHSQTQDLPAMLADADIVVAALGKPKFIQGAWLKPGCVVIDVGINRDLETSKLGGDVDFDSARQVAGYITPVPGGVGPMTIATLMENTLALYQAAKA